MAAPNGIVWGNIVTGSKSTYKGRIGIYAGVTSTATTVTVNIQTWFWSMYSVSDTNNSYYYNQSTSATSLVGSVSIKHTVSTGSGWSTSNQTKLGETSYTYTKGTSASTKSYAAKLTGIDILGNGNVMTATTSVTVPALASYNISYNANGGSGAPGSQTKWYGKTLTLSSTKPTRTGYSFQGWATSSTGGVAYSAGGSYTANAAATLYAVWKANTYTVNYNTNGGTGAPSKQTKTYGVTLKLSTTIPTRTNYNFLGWATSASATSATYSAGGNYTANTGTTLYAVWELAYIKPRISNVVLERWDQSIENKDGSFGAISDDGTGAILSFNWACDRTVESILVEWRSTTDDTWSETNILAQGVSGSVYEVIGLTYYRMEFDQDTEYWVPGNTEININDGTVASIEPYDDPGITVADNIPIYRITHTDSTIDIAYIVGLFDTDKSYQIKIGVGDNNGTSYALQTLPGKAFVIDILKEGKGISFNKPAEIEGVADFGWSILPREGFRHITLEPETDLNDIRTPNTYVGANVSNYHYSNCPLTTGTFTLEVVGMGEEGQVKQRLTYCHKTASRAWERIYYSSTWGEWVCVSDYDGQLLASPGMYMTSSHTATLAEPISAQRTGIILVFSEYVDGAAADQSFHCRFIPKRQVLTHPGKAECFQMTTSNLAFFATKYLYISDDKIVGHDNNNLTGTGACGITYTNNRFVLRYVIGV